MLAQSNAKNKSMSNRDKFLYHDLRQSLLDEKWMASETNESIGIRRYKVGGKKFRGDDQERTVTFSYSGKLFREWKRSK